MRSSLDQQSIIVWFGVSKNIHVLPIYICPTEDEESVSGKLRLAPEMARKIGGLYLMRLAGVHKRRLEVLRATVCVAPEDIFVCDACHP